MQFLDLVKQRYSCRSYQEKSVIDYLMECVRFAPSAVNKQPWQCRIVTDEAGIAKVRECYPRRWFLTAPMYIICSILHDEEWVRADGKHHGDNEEPAVLIPLGYAADEPKLKERKPIEQILK